MTFKRMIWTVVHREAPTLPQQETIKYTEPSANRMAKDIIDNGGVAIVVEGDEDIPDYDSASIPQNLKGGLEWN